MDTSSVLRTDERQLMPATNPFVSGIDKDSGGVVCVDGVACVDGAVGVDSSLFARRTFWNNSHVQTLSAAVHFSSGLAKSLAERSERIHIAIAPHGRVVIRAAWQPSVADAVLVLPGIGGVADAPYGVRASSELLAAGLHVFRMSVRGAGESALGAPTLHHAGFTDDAARALDVLANDPRVRRIHLLGFSLGGNAALKLAATWGAHAPSAIGKIASVSAPIDLAGVSRAIHRVRSRPYHHYVLRGLCEQARAFAAHGTGNLDLRELARVQTIREYDDRIVAAMHGFGDALAYYKAASSGPDLGDIRVPTLVIQAEDDPIVPAECVRPWLERARTPVRVVWSKTGGHVGWTSWGLKRGTTSWVAKTLANYFASPAW